MTAHAFKQQPTGEIAVKLDGKAVDELFLESTRALAELVGLATGDPVGSWVHEEVDSVDHSALLVTWMNQLIERIEVDRLLYAEMEIDELTDKHLRCRIRGTPIQEKKLTVRSAMIHGSHIETVDEGVTATITLEIEH